jgi:hypothetical protein
MKLECGPHWHEVSPTALLLVVQAFQQGDLHRVKLVARKDLLGIVPPIQREETAVWTAPTNHQGHALASDTAITVESQCILEAFTIERVEDFLNRYHGHMIQVDGITYERTTSNGKA